MDSSVVNQIDYDSESEETTVSFTNGHKGVYKRVPWQVVSGWEQAESKGQYFNTHVRNVYEYAALS